MANENKRTGPEQLPNGVVRWNTGNWYTEKGQPINAIRVGDRIYFNDHARGITGSVDAVAAFDESPSAVMARVMHCYEWNEDLEYGFYGCFVRTGATDEEIATNREQMRQIETLLQTW